MNSNISLKHHFIASLVQPIIILTQWFVALSIINTRLKIKPAKIAGWCLSTGIFGGYFLSQKYLEWIKN